MYLELEIDSSFFLSSFNLPRPLTIAAEDVVDTGINIV
jgi:hypothetical protein